MNKKNKLFAAGLALVLIIAFSTCDGIAPVEEEDYTDVVYDVDGNGIPKAVTLYLDGVGVPKSEAQRALNAKMAKFAFDYLEAVFKAGTYIARAQWEIGQSAGITGVQRGTGIDYGPVSGTNCSTLFVGMKSDKTLLGIGVLTACNNTAPAGGVTAGNTTISGATKAVTFTVVPFLTKIGLTTGASVVVDGDTTFYTDYVTANTVSAANTNAVVADYNGNKFPLFTARQAGATDATTKASYTIKGQSIDNLGVTGAEISLASATAVVPNSTVTGIAVAAIVNGDWVTDVKIPRFIWLGQTYAVSGDYVYAPTVTITNNDSGSSFVPTITFDIITKPGESGVFAFNFEIPVVAISEDAADNAGLLEPIQWYVRPQFGTNLYYLDNGEGTGGMVLMGVGATDADILRIFYNGIGQNY
jgi:hypothetical protein